MTGKRIDRRLLLILYILALILIKGMAHSGY